MPSLTVSDAASKEPQIAERAQAFCAWLEAEMMAGRRQAKAYFLDRATKAYELKITTFNALWAALIKKTQCGWDRPGRRRGI